MHCHNVRLAEVIAMSSCSRMTGKRNGKRSIGHYSMQQSSHETFKTTLGGPSSIATAASFLKGFRRSIRSG